MSYKPGTVPPGTYTVQQYCDSVYLGTQTHTMYHDTWSLNIQLIAPGNLIFFANLPYCNTSIYTHPSCGPAFPLMNQNILIVWEDGLPVDTVYNVACVSAAENWYSAQPGHCYDISIYDTTCNCYQATWMYNPPRTYCYPIITGAEELQEEIKSANVNYTIINTFGQVIETGKFSGDISWREKNFSPTLQSGIYYVIYSDALDNRQVFTDKIFVSGQ